MLNLIINVEFENFVMMLQKSLMDGGKEGWRSAAELDNLGQTIYYDSDARKCTAELSGIFSGKLRKKII